MQPDTRSASYAERLSRLSSKGLRRYLDVQAPYRWNLRRLDLGRTLEVGCGVGRNLRSLPPGSVGVDHNEQCVDTCRASGLEAYGTAEWGSGVGESLGLFDSLLVAHVLEHIERGEQRAVLGGYLSSVRSGGKVVCITPQPKGFRSDATHVDPVDFVRLAELADELGLHVTRQFSFPLPTLFGNVFTYNEYVSVAMRA